MLVGLAYICDNLFLSAVALMTDRQAVVQLSSLLQHQHVKLFVLLLQVRGVSDDALSA